MVHTIVFNQEQIDIIIAALQNTADANKEMSETALLIEMFNELPEIDPKGDLINGFCL